MPHAQEKHPNTNGSQIPSVVHEVPTLRGSRRCPKMDSKGAWYSSASSITAKLHVGSHRNRACRSDLVQHHTHGTKP